MYELHFQVATPNHKPLDVIFRKNGENLSTRCSCSKEENDICQHRINILCGSTEGIINANRDDVKLVRSWISGTDVGRALHALLQVITRMQKSQDDFNAAMQRLGHELNHKEKNVMNGWTISLLDAIGGHENALPGSRRTRSLSVALMSINKKNDSDASRPAGAVNLWQYGLPGTRRVRSLQNQKF